MSPIPAAWTLSQIRLRPQSSVNEFRTASFEFDWDLADTVTLKAGPQYKKFEFETDLAAALERHADQPGSRHSGQRRNDADRQLQPPRFDQRQSRCAGGRHAQLADSGPGARGRVVRSVRSGDFPARPRARADEQLLHRGRGHRRLRAGRLEHRSARPAAARQPRRSLRRDRPDLLRLRVHFRLRRC